MNRTTAKLIALDLIFVLYIAVVLFHALPIYQEQVIEAQTVLREEQRALEMAQDNPQLLEDEFLNSQLHSVYGSLMGWSVLFFALLWIVGGFFSIAKWKLMGAKNTHKLLGLHMVFGIVIILVSYFVLIQYSAHLVSAFAALAYLAILLFMILFVVGYSLARNWLFARVGQVNFSIWRWIVATAAIIIALIILAFFPRTILIVGIATLVVLLNPLKQWILTPSQ